MVFDSFLLIAENHQNLNHLSAQFIKFKMGHLMTPSMRISRIEAILYCRDLC